MHICLFDNAKIRSNTKLLVLFSAQFCNIKAIMHVYVFNKHFLYYHMRNSYQRYSNIIIRKNRKFRCIKLLHVYRQIANGCNEIFKLWKRKTIFIDICNEGKRSISKWKKNVIKTDTFRDVKLYEFCFHYVWLVLFISELFWYTHHLVSTLQWPTFWRFV